MNRSVESALNSLIPRNPGALPIALVDLASSLLAQSFHKASSLKAEEEIGRTYACAHIACERLKTTLNLPKIEPKPPCAPRIYSKLYSYFDDTLVSRVQSRKRKREEPNGSAGVARGIKARKTPTSEKSLAPFKTTRTAKQGLRHGNKGKGNENERQDPKWVAPIVRKLCTRMNAKVAIPYVFAGLDSVLSLYPPADDDEELKELDGKLTALVTALLCSIVQRLVPTEITGAAFKAHRLEATETIKALRNNREMLTRVGNDDAAWKGWEVPQQLHVHAWVKVAHERGCMEQAWYQDIEVGGGLGEAEDSPRDNGTEYKKTTGAQGGESDPEDKVSKEEDLASREDLMGYGLGTMRQPHLDFLSPANRRSSAEFRKIIMARIEAAVASGYFDAERGDDRGGRDEEEHEHANDTDSVSPQIEAMDTGAD